MDVFTVAKELGMGGVLFVAFIAVMNLGLTQIGKVIIRSFLRKRRRAQGLIEVKGDSERDAEDFGGMAVIALSLVIGGALGAWMLQGLALKLAIDLPRPLNGILLGMVLGGTVSGYVNYKQSQAHKMGGNADVLAEVLASAQPQPYQYPARSNDLPIEDARGQVSYQYEDDLRPPTPEELSRMTGTNWPEVPGLGR